MARGPPVTYQMAAAMSVRVYAKPTARGNWYPGTFSTTADPWTLSREPHYNTRDWAVWTDSGRRGGKKAVLAFRGTSLDGFMSIPMVPKTADDIYADSLILTGRLRTGTRYARSLTAAREVVRRYGADNVVITGHSLGGRLAIECAMDTGAWCIAFSPGYSPFESVSRAAHSARIVVLSSSNDPVAAAARAEGLAHDVEGASGHSSTQYEPLFTPEGRPPGYFVVEP